jgi:hypothetical protein
MTTQEQPPCTPERPSSVAVSPDGTTEGSGCHCCADVIDCDAPDYDDDDDDDVVVLGDAPATGTPRTEGTQRLSTGASVASTDISLGAGPPAGPASASATTSTSTEVTATADTSTHCATVASTSVSTSTSTSTSASTSAKNGDGDGDDEDEDGIAKIDYVCGLLAAGNNVFLHGPGGTGKSYCLQRAMARLARGGLRVACTASTGCAAMSFDDVGLVGSTLHHWSGIGLGREPAAELASLVCRNFSAKRRIRETDVLAIEEISMICAELWTKLDAVFRTVRKRPEEAFGGITLAVSGDFLQLPPVEGNLAFRSTSWTACQFMPVEFDRPHRYAGDLAFAETLLRIRVARHTAADVALIASRVGSRVGRERIRPTTLFPLRRDADRLNEQEMRKLSGPETVYTAEDCMCTRREVGGISVRTEKAVTDAFLRMLDTAIPRVLRLRVGAQVMLKKNLDVSSGLANGTRGVVVELRPAAVVIETLAGRRVPIERCEWTAGTSETYAHRLQIPLILAWGLTIHAAQGATLDSVVCDVGASIFDQGQAYVALSRCRSLSALSLVSFSPGAIKCNRLALAFADTTSSCARAAQKSKRSGAKRPVSS